LVDVWYFDATDVHVGDAAQLQLIQSVRWEFIKDAYIKTSITYFDNNYADFDPITLSPNFYANPDDYLDDDGKPRDSWKMPYFYLLDLHAGYRIRLNKYNINFRVSILNLLDEMYITDARNNDTFIPLSTNNFDAQSASVHFGMGRRFDFSIKISF